MGDTAFQKKRLGKMGSVAKEGQVPQAAADGGSQATLGRVKSEVKRRRNLTKKGERYDTSGAASWC